MSDHAPPDIEAPDAIDVAFAAALDLPQRDRPALLDKLRAESPAVAEAVAKLLQAEDAAGDFLGRPPASAMQLTRSIMQGPEHVPAAHPPGTRLLHFDIVRAIGAGAFANVYLARDRRLDRLVALKVSLAKGFEARTMAVLEHDHVVRVFSEHVDRATETRTICMQLVGGPSMGAVLEYLADMPAPAAHGKMILRAIDNARHADVSFSPELVRERTLLETLPPAQATAWISAKIAAALAFAHSQGILHLDVKPDNILFSPYGRPLLADFNVALHLPKVMDVKDWLYGGTLRYMAPEHRHAFDSGKREAFKEIGPPADVYALGIVMEELAHAGVPREGDVQGDDDERELDAIIRRCISAAPAARPTANNLASQLEDYLELQRMRRTLPPNGAVLRFSRRWPLAANLIFLATPQLIAGVVNAVYNESQLVRHLTEGQHAAFRAMIPYVNSILYTVCTAAIIMFILPLLSHIVATFNGAPPLEGEAQDRMRRRTLQYPGHVTVVSLAGWAIAMIAFPVSMDYMAGPLGRTVYEHFAIDFALTATVALTYSYLYAQSFALGVAYPALLHGCAKPREVARRELRPIVRRLPYFQIGAGLVPLLAACLLLFLRPTETVGMDFDVLRLMLVGLILSGSFGLFVALQTASHLSRTVAALSQ